MISPLISGLQFLQAGWGQLVTGMANRLPDRVDMSLKTQIRVLDGCYRALIPLRGFGGRWETATARLENKLSRAERTLARHHAENLFSNELLCRLIFSTPFGSISDDLCRKEAVFEKIDRDGMDGYLEILVAAINQHWAPIYMGEILRGRNLMERGYNEMDDCQGPSVAIVLSLLNAISADPHIEARFQRRWNAFCPLYPIETVRERMAGVSSRYQKEYQSQSLL